MWLEVSETRGGVEVDLGGGGGAGTLVLDALGIGVLITFPLVESEAGTEVLFGGMVVVLLRGPRVVLETSGVELETMMLFGNGLETFLRSITETQTLLNPGISESEEALAR